jgi:hypothetical protein
MMRELFKISEENLENALDKNNSLSQKDNLIEIMKTGAIGVILDSNDAPINLLTLDENNNLMVSKIMDIPLYKNPK